jgi:hypothetical protein
MQIGVEKTTGILLFVLFVLLTLSSCQKEITGDLQPTDSNQSTAMAKVKTYTEEYTSGTTQRAGTYELTYDGSGRVLSINSTSTPGDKFVFNYNSDNTYSMDLYNANVLSIHQIFFLNNLPLVDSSFQYDLAMDTTTEKYLYNSSNQLVSLKFYSYSNRSGSKLLNTTSYTYDNNGNIVNETDAISNTTYEYYPDLANNLSLGFIYLVQDKNLVKTTTYTLGSTKQTTNHTYTFDSNHRVTSEKAISNNGEVLVKTYTYF